RVQPGRNLFPYTTLFRSHVRREVRLALRGEDVEEARGRAGEGGEQFPRDLDRVVEADEAGPCLREDAELLPALAPLNAELRLLDFAARGEVGSHADGEEVALGFDGEVVVEVVCDARAYPRGVLCGEGVRRRDGERRELHSDLDLRRVVLLRACVSGKK